MHKIIIIDDEPLARLIIRDYLKNFPDMEVISECSNGFEGLKAISQMSPDLVFLDIQMPKISGLEMLELLDNPPAVIFTTAFDEYAIKAFDANAIDYLLKPFSQERFNKSIQRWLEQNTPGNNNSFGSLLQEAPQLYEQKSRIVVKSGHNIKIIPFDDIQYVEAYDDYIKIHISNDCFLKKQTMMQTEVMLGESKFVRAHRSFIVSLAEITRIEPLGKESYIAVLRDGTKIPLSKTGYSKVRSLLGI